MSHVSCRYYSSTALRRLRRPTQPVPVSILNILKAVGLLRFRGSRAGAWKLRTIPSITSTTERYGLGSSHQPLRARCLLSVPLLPIEPPTPTTGVQSSSPTAGFSSPPALLVLNPTSLGKPHALEILHADMTSLGIDVAMISETWFMKHIHSAASTDIAGYTCYRRDRVDGCRAWLFTSVHQPPQYAALSCITNSSRLYG